MLKGINSSPQSSEADLFTYQLEYEENNSQYDGNITKAKWQTPTKAASCGSPERVYAYTYDAGQRLVAVTYTGSGDFSLPLLAYDKNSNIKNLQRKGKLANGGFGLIDDLTYTNTANHPTKITDNVARNNLVDLAPNGNNDYTYNKDGSLTADQNQGISAITYDSFIKLQQSITATGQTKQHYYTAGGSLIKTTCTIGAGTTGDTWEYFGNMVYKNGKPFSIATPEGRAIIEGGGWNYEFDHVDLLGNTRVSYRNINSKLVVTAVNDMDPFGVPLLGLETVNGYQNKFQMQGKERTNGLNRVDFGFRTFCPATGIWDRSDILSEMTPDQSPHSYVFGNSINFIDEFGLSGCGFNTRGREETDAEKFTKDMMAQADNRGFITNVSNYLLGTTNSY